MTEMHHIGLFVHGQAYAMTAQIAHNAIMILLGMLLNGMPDIADKAIRLGCLGTNLQTLLGHSHQLFFLRCRLSPDDEHA